MYAEVETRISALRSLLLEKLLQTPSTLHDQKRYIRSLHIFITAHLSVFRSRLVCVSRKSFLFSSNMCTFCFFVGFLYTSLSACSVLFVDINYKVITCLLSSFSSLRLVSLMSVFVIVCQNFIFLSLFSVRSAFCCPRFSFPVFPLHPSVHSYLWASPIYYC